jgi:hypothetical protein
VIGSDLRDVDVRAVPIAAMCADAIGVPDPDKPGFHRDARPLIEQGLALCGTTSAPGTPTGGTNRPAGLVERETWTDGRWPFTVDVATLLCNKADDVGEGDRAPARCVRFPASSMVPVLVLLRR